MVVWGGVLTTLLFTLLISLASCDNGSTSSPSEKNPSGGSTLNQPDESLKIPEDKYSVKENPDGIYFEFDVPEKTWQIRVYIDGIGQVAEEVRLNESGDKGEFFYPFLDASKEYTVRIEFLKEEDMDEDGFVLNTPDQTIGYIEAKITTGAKSKGEVRLEYCGKVEVEENGDFKFIERPVFKNESRLTGSDYDWTEAVCPVEGVSWMHEGRKTKWGGEILIPQKFLAQTHNLYISNYNGWKNDLKSIDFLCCRPKMKYTYNGKEFTYQWDSFCYDTPNLTPEASLWKTIDINNFADVKKIVGTWKYNYEGFGSMNGVQIKVLKDETTLEIDLKNVTKSQVFVFTKPDGSEFTDEEKEKLHIEKEDISTDGKITQKYSNTEPISEYFADYSDDYKNHTRHYTVKLFSKYGSTLRIICSGTDDGKPYEWNTDYKKQ